MSWRCSLCGVEHDELPLVFGADAPWWLFVAEEDFDAKVELQESICIVDETHFFVRGHIQLPIHDSEQVFTWSVWCSLSKDSFARMMSTWDEPERVNAEPYFGWLCTELPTYGQKTLHLKTLLFERAPGTVPIVRLEPTGHPLAVEQKAGIARRRVEEIAHAVLGHAG